MNWKTRITYAADIDLKEAYDIEISIACHDSVLGNRFQL